MILTNIHGKEFYNSEKHIVGDTREKRRCNLKYDWIWQYMTYDDKDGIRFGQCIAIDTRELADLKERGVKYYKCFYTDRRVYRISLEEFQKWAVPVHNNREGDGEQVCVSWRHWEDLTKYPKAKKEKKATLKRKKEWHNLSMFR